MALPSTVTLGSLAFIVVAGVGFVAVTSNASEDDKALSAPAPSTTPPAATPPAATVPTGRTPTAQTPTGQTSTWQTPTAQTPTAQTPTGQTPTGQTPTAQTPTAQTPTGQTPTAQTPASPTPSERLDPTKSHRTSAPRPEPKPKPEPTPDDVVPAVFVEVYNNSGITGLAADKASFLDGAGWNVSATDNWYGDIPSTTVYYPARLRSQATKLAETLGVARLRPAISPMQFDRLTVILTGTG